VTDDYGALPVENPVHVHDYHATILHAMGIDHQQLTYRYAGRDFRLTDVAGNVLHDVLLSARPGTRLARLQWIVADSVVDGDGCVLQSCLLSWSNFDNKAPESLNSHLHQTGRSLPGIRRGTRQGTPRGSDAAVRSVRVPALARAWAN
jgi:hypothetical protein